MYADGLVSLNIEHISQQTAKKLNIFTDRRANWLEITFICLDFFIDVTWGSVHLSVYLLFTDNSEVNSMSSMFSFT